MKKLIFFLAIFLFGFIAQKSYAQCTITGNAVVAADFLGTSNAFPVSIMANLQKAGWIDYAGPYNTTFGYQAGNSLTNTSTLNIAIGYEALPSNTVESGNIAIGDSAMYTYSYSNLVFNIGNVAIGNSALFACNAVVGFGGATHNTAVGEWAIRNNKYGEDNTAVGSEALYSDTGRGENTAVGSRALFSNTNGINNVAIGFDALPDNTTGVSNTATGEIALGSNTTGSNNTATGLTALGHNTTGWDNTAAGFSALAANTTGSSLTAVGNRAGYNSTGSWNTFVGDSAGADNTTGTFNTYLGYKAGDSATGFAALSNTTCLGYKSGAGAATPASNSIYLGNSNITHVYCECILRTNQPYQL